MPDRGYLLAKDILDIPIKMVHGKPEQTNSHIFQFLLFYRIKMHLHITLIENDSDMTVALNIRVKVFVEEQKVSKDIELDEFEDDCSHILARFDGIPVGTARWRRTEKGIKLERFAVLEEYRGNGIGEALVESVLSYVLPEPTVYLHAQKEVIGFYEKLGFSSKGDTFIEADIVHQKMVL
jgi:predicted GNAT family N-acyltransferase